MTSQQPHSWMTETLSLARVETFFCLHNVAWEINLKIITLLVVIGRRFPRENPKETERWDGEWNN